MKNTLPLVAVLLVGVSAFAQEWASVTKTDQLTAKSYTEFTLQGKYLAPPSHAEGTPSLVLRCDPSAHHGRINGKFIAGFVVVGAILDLPMQYRLDDGKVQTASGDTGLVGYSSNFQAVSLNSIMANNFLWGHLIPHKPGKGEQVHKVVVSVPEHLAGQIVMQFDMPSAEAVGSACGTEYGK
jgi:hypothetical protein